MALAAGPMGGHMGMMGGRSTASQTPSVATGPEATIEIKDFAFAPADLTVRAGTKVTWVNRDAAPHDAAADGEGWRTEVLSKGDSATITFDTPGAYTYHCSIHPYMKAVVTVQP
jgi:plastocyanin